MRRPNRSNVMRRRLFNNGGMGMTKPGANVASGILSSSQPLVDVLAGQARDNFTNGINVGNQIFGSNNINVGNQMYGSNVQGTNLMNQGGVANYAPGGISYTTNEAGDVLRVPVSGSVEEAEIVNNEGLGMFAGMDSEQFNFSDAPGNRFSRIIDQKGAVELFDRKVEKGTQDPTKPMILPDGTVVIRNANGETEIAVKGRQSGDDIYEANAPQNLTAENTGLPLTKAEDLLTFERRDMPTEQYPSETETETDVVTEGELPGYSNSDMSSSGGKKQDVIDYGSLISPITDNSNIEEIDDIVVTGESDTKTETETETEGNTDQVTDPYDFTDKDLYDAFDANVVDDVRANANANDEKTTEEKMAAFKEEFKNAMPEYQGMSDEEKGNAWIKMGMAIAAGQSGNAITNIANGVLATIDEFADDPKQKREYEMKVALAGSKYALERLGADRVKLEGIEAENRTILDYVTSTPFTFNGKEYAKGDPFQITRSQFNDGILNKLPKGAVVQPPIFKDMEDTLQSFNAFQATLSSSGAKMGDWIKERDLYGTVVEDMKSGINMRLYLGEASELLNNGEVAGAQGLLLSGFDQALNFLNLDQTYLTNLRSSDKQLYNQKMKEVGTQMLTQILGETNRTISDNDRKLVNELTALIGDFRATGQNIDVINEKILSIDRKIQDGLQANSIKLQGIEATWGEGVKVKDSGVIPSDELRKNREAQFPSQRGRATTDGTQKIFKYEDIWDIENNVFKRGVDWGSN